LGTSLLFGITEEPREETVVRKPSFFSELREGFKLVWEIKWLAASIFMASFQLMVIVAAETVLLPVITRREFDTNSVFAISAALFSLGGMISAIAAIKFQTKKPGLVAISMWSLFAFAPLVLAFPISPAVVIIGYFIAGLSIGGWEAYWVTAVQREVPQEMQGRVFSIDFVGSSGLMPIGMALVGPAVLLIGERNFLLFAIAFHVIICYLVLLVPGVKELSDPRKSQGNSTISEQGHS
jgi:uncharacterized membrane protein YiaA